MEWYIIVVLCILQCIVSVFGDELCYIDETDQWEFCDNGCCGREHEDNRRCCSDTEVLVWIIVGSVIGGIVVISCIVAFVVFCVYVNSKSGSRRQGTVVNPTPTTTVYQLNTYPNGTTITGPPAYVGAPPAYSQGPVQTGQNYPPPNTHNQLPYPQQPQTNQNPPIPHPSNVGEMPVPGPAKY